MPTTFAINSAANLQQMHVRVFSKESAEKIAQLGKRALEVLLKLITRLSRIITAPLRIGSALAAGNSVSPGNVGISSGYKPSPIESSEPFHKKRKFPTPIVEPTAPEISAKLSDIGFVNDDGASDALLFGSNQENGTVTPGDVLAGRYDIYLVLEGAPEDLKQAYQPILERISLVLDWIPSQFDLGEFNDESISNVVEVAEDLERLQAALKLTETQMLLVSQNIAKSAASEYDSKQNDVLSYIIEMQQKGAKQDDFQEGSGEGDLFRIVSLASRFKSAIAAREDFLLEILNQAKPMPELYSKLENAISGGRNRIREKTGLKPAQVEIAQDQIVDSDSTAMITKTNVPVVALELEKSHVKPKVVGGMFSNSGDQSSLHIDDSDGDLTEETEFIG